MKQPTCKELAAKIYAHLKRFAADPELSHYTRDGKKYTRFWSVSAYGTTRVNVFYISYQRVSVLTKAEAIKYLEWLDAGNVGHHYQALREAK